MTDYLDCRRPRPRIEEGFSDLHRKLKTGTIHVLPHEQIEAVVFCLTSHERPQLI
jgi:hypothetical protein